MTRHTGLPTPHAVQAALSAMTGDDNQVSVLALARRLSLANTTFRRNFPDVVAQLARQIPAAADPSGRTRPDRARDLAHANAVLRTHNHDLRRELDLACAEIQRLALETGQPQDLAHTAERVTTLEHGQMGASRRDGDDAVLLRRPTPAFATPSRGAGSSNRARTNLESVDEPLP